MKTGKGRPSGNRSSPKPVPSPAVPFGRTSNSPPQGGRPHARAPVTTPPPQGPSPCPAGDRPSSPPILPRSHPAPQPDRKGPNEPGNPRFHPRNSLPLCPDVPPGDWFPGWSHGVDAPNGPGLAHSGAGVFCRQAPRRSVNTRPHRRPRGFRPREEAAGDRPTVDPVFASTGVRPRATRPRPIGRSIPRPRFCDFSNGPIPEWLTSPFVFPSGK